VIAHRFSSPTWLKHLLRHISASDGSSKELWDKVRQNTWSRHNGDAHNPIDSVAEHGTRHSVLSERPMRQVLGRESRTTSVITWSRLSHCAVAFAGDSRRGSFASGRPGRKTFYATRACACDYSGSGNVAVAPPNGHRATKRGRSHPQSFPTEFKWHLNCASYRHGSKSYCHSTATSAMDHCVWAPFISTHFIAFPWLCSFCNGCAILSSRGLHALSSSTWRRPCSSQRLRITVQNTECPPHSRLAPSIPSRRRGCWPRLHRESHPCPSSPSASTPEWLGCYCSQSSSAIRTAPPVTGCGLL
jgi:hypothetical protein